MELAKLVSDATKGDAVKTWFCTWPKCAIPKEFALKLLEEHGLKEYIVAEEKHEDGSPHLHAYLKLLKKKKFNAKMFDLKDADGKEYHGNYQKVRDVLAVEKYVAKGKNYVSNIDIEAAEQHKSKLVKEDYLKDPLELLEEGKINFFQLNNFIKNQDCYKMLLNRKSNRPLKPLEKRRHFWIFGESNTGKTERLWKAMDEIEGGWFQIPTNNDWKGYNGEKNLYMDEYKGQLTVQELNRICDGGAKVNTKGGTTQLSWEVTVWICSNYSIENCYKKVERVLLESLWNRFNEEEKVFDPDYKKKLDN